ncbi:putative RNA-directed DNA polymerase [Helianthus annuus]|nr:putative RNA-directed DNA polymerase [Helianthus annuus]KAJ0472377.1 putative RNA-directed DNA polymerase [Helianthus annuus]KAJ0647976.1 putative RNA-directed DNA polymerase [Helianthus annuus]
MGFLSMSMSGKAKRYYRMVRVKGTKLWWILAFRGRKVSRGRKIIRSIRRLVTRFKLGFCWVWNWEEWALSENLLCIKEIEDNKTKDLKQRSRVRWAKDGDENSSFFHSMINCRKACNSIHGLQVNGSWCSKPTLIKKHVFEFFRLKFKEDVKVRPRLNCSHLKRLSLEEANLLVSEFSVEELKAAVWDCGSNRAPGPDGLNFKFFKHFWDVFEGDFVNVLNEFFLTGSVSRGCASSFITLIPKVKDPSDLNEFRPISLVGAINKVISKVLANRLKKVISSVISENQSGFIKGKFILDGPLVISEMVNWIKKKKKKAFLFKLDFEKAYDNVNWGFVDSVMTQMGFPQRWCSWVAGILSSARAAVLVNGSPTFDFQCEKGMRQGDPLSPFLFLLVMEALTACLSKAEDLGLVKGIDLPNEGPKVSHLFFADDALIVGDWSRGSIFNVVRILRCFRICSGLSINLVKSSLIGIGISDSEVVSLSSEIGCKAEQFPFKYLGLPVGANMNRISNWSSVIDMFEARLSLWKAALLSIGGRVTLIKSVLQSLPIYFFSLFKVPVGVINQLEAIMRKFLWGGSRADRKTCWVSWDCVTEPISSGGLGIRKLGLVNSALLFKWAWRYKAEGNSLWAKVVSAIHSHSRSWEFLPVNSSLGGVWGNIVKVVNKPIVGSQRFRQFMLGEIGDGRKVAFWLDPWLKKDPLRFCFPNLFDLEIEKNCCVRDRLFSPFSNPSAAWRWKKPPDDSIVLAEWAALCCCLRDVTLSDARDKWKWLPDDSFSFSVSSAYELLRSKEVSSSMLVWEWCRWVPIKCNVFAWRAVRERLPTKVELSKRNIQVGAVSCPLCESGDETALHLFTACGFATAVWAKVCLWCKVPFLVAFSFKDILEAHRFNGLKGNKSLAFQGIVLIACWLIWKARNELVFNGSKPNPDEVFCSIKSVGFLWFKNRAKCIDISWSDWCKFV